MDINDAGSNFKFKLTMGIDGMVGNTCGFSAESMSPVSRHSSINLPTNHVRTYTVCKSDVHPKSTNQNVMSHEREKKCLLL